GNADAITLKKQVLDSQGKQQLDQRKYRDSYATLNQLSKIAPNYEDSATLMRQTRTRLIDEYYNTGSLYYREEKLPEAIAQWKAVLEIDPQHVNARKNLDQAERLLKQLDERRKRCSRHERLFERPSAPHHRRGRGGGGGGHPLGRLGVVAVALAGDHGRRLRGRLGGRGELQGHGQRRGAPRPGQSAGQDGTGAPAPRPAGFPGQARSGGGRGGGGGGGVAGCPLRAPDDPRGDRGADRRGQGGARRRAGGGGGEPVRRARGAGRARGHAGSG